MAGLLGNKKVTDPSPNHAPGLIACDWCMDHSILGKVLWRIFMGTWRIRHSKQCWSSQENLYLACIGIQMMCFSTALPSMLWPGTLTILTMLTYTSVFPWTKTSEKVFPSPQMSWFVQQDFDGDFNSNIYFILMKMHCRWWSRSTDSLEKRSQHPEVPEPNLWEAGC